MAVPGRRPPTDVIMPYLHLPGILLFWGRSVCLYFAGDVKNNTYLFVERKSKIVIFEVHIVNVTMFPAIGYGQCMPREFQGGDEILENY